MISSLVPSFSFGHALPLSSLLLVFFLLLSSAEDASAAERVSAYGEALVNVTSSNFYDYHATQDVVLLFYAPWCMFQIPDRPKNKCMLAMEVLNHLAQTRSFQDEAGGPILLGKVNGDENRELKRKYRISTYPEIFYVTHSSPSLYSKFLPPHEEHKFVEWIEGKWKHWADKEETTREYLARIWNDASTAFETKIGVNIWIPITIVLAFGISFYGGLMYLLFTLTAPDKPLSTFEFEEAGKRTPKQVRRKLVKAVKEGSSSSEHDSSSEEEGEAETKQESKQAANHSAATSDTGLRKRGGGKQ
ncbi:hypothetical protein QOT17_008216 [Balamuthia mandrillaris]